MKRALPLIAATLLLTPAPASAAKLSHKEARAVLLAKAHRQMPGYNRITVGHCRRLNRQGIVCRITTEGPIGCFASERWVALIIDHTVTVRSAWNMDTDAYGTCPIWGTIAPVDGEPAIAAPTEPPATPHP